MIIDRLPSGSYRARVLIGNNKYKTFSGKDKKDVQLRAAQFEAERKTDKPDDPYAGMTVGEAMERYVEAKKNTLSPKTYREYTQLRRNSLKSLHDIKLADLTQEQVQIAVGEAAVDHEPKTVRNMHGLLSSALKMFRPDFTLHTKLPQKKKPDIIIPTESDVVALLAEVQGTDIDAPVHLAALCGMRMSEILGLRWDKIDFEKKTICVCAAKVRDIDNNIVLKGTKSTAGERTIKMLPAVETALRRAREAMPGSEFITDLKSNNIYDRYQKALKAVCDKHYTFHELRHYAASVMIMLGIPVKYIADYLGHETEDMVNRVYGHIMADKKDEMFERLATYYNGVLKKSVMKSVT